MTILTVDELREHIETDLADTAMTRLMNAAEGLIVAVTGVIATHTDNLEGGLSSIYTTRAVETITSIKERDYLDDVQVTLSTDDYRIEQGFRLLRLREGTNPRLFWASSVEVIYAPDVDTGLIQEVQITLVRLAVVNAGATRERNGDFDFWHPDKADATNSALHPLNNSRMRMMLR